MIFPQNLPQGKTLMIHPPYIHYRKNFIKDPKPFMPIGLLFAGQILEKLKACSTEYFDCQLHDINKVNLTNYDSFGIHVMGAQNIASAYQIYNFLKNSRIHPKKIYFGGQGIEGLSKKEFNKIFPGATKVTRKNLLTEGYWQTSIRNQLKKFSEKDLKTYLNNELTLLFSQGCIYSCTFCGARNGMKEKFYNTISNLKLYLDYAQKHDITFLEFYITSLDFFQQTRTKEGLCCLKTILKKIKSLKLKYNIEFRIRALTRVDSYLKAIKDKELIKLLKETGFYQFGFGADGAANEAIIKSMRKGDLNLKRGLIKAFKHAEENGFVPEILYVFGVEGETVLNLHETEELCKHLLKQFKTSVYRGFPAKNFIPGNVNWEREDWKSSKAYKKLLQNPYLFLNLGFETLANEISHPCTKMRKLVNQHAISISHYAHTLNRVQSFLTIPLLIENTEKIMDKKSFCVFKKIICSYGGVSLEKVSLVEMMEKREELNCLIPKDS